MRINLVEKGKIYSVKNGETHQIQTYIRVYSQPIFHAIISWLYHNVWERVTWRIVRYFERFQNKDFDTIPYTCRQDIRCYNLNNYKRIYIVEKFEKCVDET